MQHADSTSHLDRKMAKRLRMQECMREMKRLVSRGDQSMDSIEALEASIHMIKEMQGDSAAAAAAGSTALSPPQSCDDGEHSIAPPAGVPQPSSSPCGVRLPEGALFFVHCRLTDGLVVDSKCAEETVHPQDVCVGVSFYQCLLTNTQSFILSAAATSKQQRIFSRMRNAVGEQIVVDLHCRFHDNSAYITAFPASCFPARPPAESTTVMHTRHSANLGITHADCSSVALLGHLPTDLIGRTLLAFVYAPDVHLIRQAHFDLHARSGARVFTSAFVRFVTHNGQIVRAGCEWSGYVNPWSNKIDMVVGRHIIVDWDGCTLPAAREGPPPVLNRQLARPIEDEIRAVLARPVSTACPGQAVGAAPAAAAAGMSPHAIGTYIDRIVESLVCATPAVSNFQPVAAGEAGPSQPGPSQQSHNSPSPLRDDSEIVGVDAESGLPLTYNQINCLENVHRLLKSQSMLEAGPAAGQAQHAHCDASVLPPVPLTREMLAEHTRRWEEEYRQTWRRRLAQKRLMLEPAPGPAAKRASPPPAAASPPARRTPSQPIPPGSNFHITTEPLPDRPEIIQLTPQTTH